MKTTLPNYSLHSAGKSHSGLTAYAQDAPLNIAGQFQARVKSTKTGKSIRADFLVVKGQAKSKPLLSLQTSKPLGVLHIINAMDVPETVKTETCTPEGLMANYPEVFTGLGKHKKITTKLIVDPSLPPVCQKQRKIPYNMVKKAGEEEVRLKQLGVIEEVPADQPTTW